MYISELLDSESEKRRANPAYEPDLSGLPVNSKAGGGRRKPRASFTRTLFSICSSLDERPSRDVAWRFAPLRWKGTESIGVERLWVAGSYARGASECGDLDLVAQTYPLNPLRAAGPDVARTFFRYPDVRPHLGTPDKNSSGIAFPESVLIWRPQEDWKRLIESIPLDDKAGRFVRPIDALPLRMTEQTKADIQVAEDLLVCWAARLIDWRFFPLDEIKADHLRPDLETALDDNRLFYKRGKKTAELVLPLARLIYDQGWLRANEIAELFRYGESTSVQWLGTAVEMGRPYINPRRLDEYDVVRLIIAPHRSARGPNGFWVIERGEDHSLVGLAEERYAYVIQEENGQPIVFYEGRGAFSHVGVVDLFTKEKQALTSAAAIMEGTAEDDDAPLFARQISGRALLSVIALAQKVYVYDDEYPLTRRACESEDKSDLKSVTDVLAALPKLSTRSRGQK